MTTEKNPQVKQAVIRLVELSGDERTRLLYESHQKTVVNDPEVKLGLDSDRWRVPVAITMIAISLSGLAVLCFLRRKKGRKEAEEGA